MIESLEFLGTVNNEERRVIWEAFPDSLRGKITIRGQFDPSRKVRDPDVEVVFDETLSEPDASDSSSE